MNTRSERSALEYGERLAPDYNGRGVFNLAASLAQACGSGCDHPGLTGALHRELQATRRVVLWLIDGLGEALLASHAASAPNLIARRVGSLLSVFPSTTAAAITTLMCARSPAEHGLIGWHVFEPQSAAVVAPLPMRTRRDWLPLPPESIEQLLGHSSVFSRAERRTAVVVPQEIITGPYSEHHHAGAQSYGYTALLALPETVRQAQIACGEGPSFVYAYTASLDATAHRYGPSAPEVAQLLSELDATLRAMISVLPSDCLLLISADHGFTDAPLERCIDLSEDAELVAMLRAPLSGERRAAFCHVHREVRDDFAQHVRRRYGEVLDLLPITELLAAGWLGPGQAHPALHARLGDYLLLPRENWSVIDRLPGERIPRLRGLHGGASRQEMLVPLIRGSA